MDVEMGVEIACFNWLLQYIEKLLTLLRACWLPSCWLKLEKKSFS